MTSRKQTKAEQQRADALAMQRMFLLFTDVQAAKSYVTSRYQAYRIAGAYQALNRLVEMCENPEGRFGLPEAGDERLVAVLTWAKEELFQLERLFQSYSSFIRNLKDSGVDEETMRSHLVGTGLEPQDFL